jgi:hypothetical protein
MSNNAGSKGSKLSRRNFLTGSATAAAGVLLASKAERADAFFNMGALWKKPTGNGQTSNGYTIGQSLRFNSANTNLTRTASSNGTNVYKAVISFWVKRAGFGEAVIFDVGNGAGSWELVRFDSTDKITCWLANNTGCQTTSRVFRDPAAWLHVYILWDTTQATGTDRMQLWINGVRETAFDTNTIPAQNTSFTYLNQTGQTYRWGGLANGYNLNGYLTECYLVFDQATMPAASDFGQIDTNTGQWIPKQVAIADFGKNGCYLNFSNSSSLGADSAPISGNHTSANNWTPTNFQVYDQVLDSPTNNFCTLNPLQNSNNAAGTMTAGNLMLTSVSGQNNGAAASFDFPTGKWYWEYTVSGYCGHGYFGLVANRGSVVPSAANSLAWDSNFWYIQNLSGSSGVIRKGNTTLLGSLAIFALNDVVQIAIDSTNGLLWVGKNGSWFNSGAPASGTGAITTTGLLDGTLTSWAATTSNGWGAGSSTFNYGQGGQSGLIYDSASGGRFKYTPPAGFKALCTANLPSTMPVVTSGAFTGNANADGPFVWLGGSPTDLTINGNVVIWGTHADKLASGFKIRTSSASYNAGSTNSFSATVPAKFKWATARTNP